MLGGSSAADFVTDLTDVRREGSSAADFVTDLTDVRRKEVRQRIL